MKTKTKAYEICDTLRSIGFSIGLMNDSSFTSQDHKSKYVLFNSMSILGLNVTIEIIVTDYLISIVIDKRIIPLCNCCPQIDSHKISGKTTITFTSKTPVSEISNYVQSEYHKIDHQLSRTLLMSELN